MPSTRQFRESQPKPWAPLHELIQWLSGTATHLMLAFAIGAVAAREMRRRHLHWSWALLVLALIAVTGSSLAGLAPTIAIAALFAAVRGRRWQQHDLDTGADLAQAAAARLTPLDSLQRWGAGALRRLRSTVLDSNTAGDQLLALGLDERERIVAIPFAEHSGGRHTLVVGATGSGKTVTQTLMAVRSIERGMGAIVIDPKGDEGMRGELELASQLAGRRFLQWTPAGHCVYNPYANGSETEIADKALAGERFTEPHYLRQAQRYLGHAIRALRRGGVQVSLSAIVEHLDPCQLEVLARTLPEADASATHAYLDSLSARQQSDLAGVRDRLATLVESDVGPWLDPHTTHAQQFDLLDAVREHAVVYFNLEADRRPLLAQMLGAAIVQDLQTAVAALQGSPVATVAVIDEFSAVAAEQVIRLFGRARSAGISLVLGTQEISDLRIAGAELLLERIIGNLSVLIAHRQVVPSSAELISSVAGTRGAWKVARHSDGRATRTRTRERLLEPDRIMGLGQGWAAVIVPGEAVRAQIAHVFPPRPRR